VAASIDYLQTTYKPTGEKVDSHKDLPYCFFTKNIYLIQDRPESHAARKLCNATAVLFSLKFANNIHYCKFKSSQASKVRLQSGKHTSTKENLMQNDDS